MPVYHFTYHGYRTWNADHPDGYCQHGVRERLRTCVPLGAYRNWIADGDAMVFGEGQLRSMFEFLKEICGRRNWRLHGVGMDATHVHVVVSWKTEWDGEMVKDRVKNLLSLLLNRWEGREGRRVFSKGAGKNRVRDATHLWRLRERYLPGHPWYWCEGMEGLRRGGAGKSTQWGAEMRPSQ